MPRGSLRSCSGIWSKEKSTTANKTTEPQAKRDKEPKKTPRLSELLEQFLKSRTSSKNIRAATLNEYRTAVADLIFVIGDRPVHQYTFDDAELFRDSMQTIPLHRNKKPAYIGKAFNELKALSIPSEECIGGRTIADRLGYLKTYFNWLVSKGTVDRNPFADVSITYEENHWPDYKDTDLRTIFSSALYVESKYARQKTTRAAHWWLPLLCLYAGARPSELVQMRLQDIAENDGILCATVIDEGEGMSAKTNAARRTFPIHPVLLKLGFEDYVTACRTAGYTRVLEGIKLGGRKAADNASKWWNERYRARHLPGDFKPSRKVLYSFRCTYVTKALNSGVDLRHLQQMVGHEKEHMGATKFYDRGATIPQLRNAIDKIEFEAVDWERLAGGWQRFKQL